METQRKFERKKSVGGTVFLILEEPDIASTQKNDSRIIEARKW